MQGQIIKALAGFYYVESEGKVYQTRARGNFRKKGHTPYVGDWVDFSAEENSEGYILKIHERKNSLVRPPIVNIDQAVVIMSVKEPDFNSNLLDRFLVLLEHKGIHPIVYISKMDLLEDRGRHTTRAVSFYNLNGGKIADTPGFSSLDYEASTAEDLNQSFPEIATVSRDCKFRTCTHTHEPSCAVKPAVEEGAIATFRFDNYLQFLSEIENRRETYKKVSKKIPK